MTQEARSLSNIRHRGERHQLYPTTSCGFHFSQMPFQTYLLVFSFCDSSLATLVSAYYSCFYSWHFSALAEPPSTSSAGFCPSTLGLLYLCLSSWVDECSCSPCLMVPGPHKSLMIIEWIHEWAQDHLRSHQYLIFLLIPEGLIR